MREMQATLVQHPVAPVVGHTAHGNWLAGRMASRCQRDVEQARGLAGIIEKQFIKVTHAIEHKGVGVIGLDAQVLLHHWCVLCIFSFRIHAVLLFYLLIYKLILLF